MITKAQLEKMSELLKLADECYGGICYEFLEFIFDKIDCDKCPKHSYCNTAAELKTNPDNLEGDCVDELYEYIFEDQEP